MADAVVPNRRNDSSATSQSAKAAASGGFAAALVIAYNGYCKHHALPELTLEEGAAYTTLATSLIHPFMLFGVALGNKLAQKMGLGIKFHIPNGENGNGSNGGNGTPPETVSGQP